MPWQDKAFKHVPFEVITVAEDQMIFNERDEEGNQIPPGTDPGAPGESMRGGLSRENQEGVWQDEANPRQEEEYDRGTQR